MLTGVLADIHGVYNNQPGCFQDIPKGLTIYEEIEISNPDVKTAFIFSNPQNWRKLYGNITGLVDYFFTKVSLQKVVAAKTIEMIKQSKNNDFFIVLHFRYPDAAGHKYGADSEEYKNMILEIDRQLGNVLQTLSNKGG